MKKLLLIMLILSSINTVGISQTIYLTSDIAVSFFSEARLENIEATSVKSSSAINIITKELAFKVPIQSFVFKNGLMQEHFNENYMESHRYPNATFKGKIKEDVNLAENGEYSVNVEGKLIVHGITVDRTISGTIVVKNGIMELHSSFIIPVSDHKIDIPNDKITNISQDITVKIKALYELKK